MSAPIITATWQAGVLSAASSILGQSITCYQSGKSLSIDFTSLFQFVLYTVLTTPINFIWQAWLEATFPGYTSRLGDREKEKLVDDVVAGHSTAVPSHEASDRKDADGKSMTSTSAPKPPKQTAQQLNIRNTAIKFTLDQTLGAGVNNVLFLAGLPLLQGKSRAAITENVRVEFWPLIFAGQKVWPLVSLLSFTLIPVEYRLVFGSTVGLFWGAYLSMITATK